MGQNTLCRAGVPARAPLIPRPALSPLPSQHISSAARPAPASDDDDGGEGPSSSSLLESLLLGRRAGGRTSTSSDDRAAADPTLHPHYPGADDRWRALAAADLDAFLGRVYRYWHEKGLAVIVTARLLNLAALAFTAGFSALALLVVQWGALGAPCIREGTCDISAAALDWHPFRRPPDGRRLSAWTVGCGAYLAAFALYWCGAAAAVGVDLAATASVACFYQTILGLSDRQTRAVPWAEVARRLVEAQLGGRLVLVREGGAGGGPGGAAGTPIVLDEAGLVGRIMRLDNLLIALLGSGALALTPPRRGGGAGVLGVVALPAWLGGGGRSLTLRAPRLGPSRPALPRVLEWNLRACALDPLFAGSPGGDAIDRTVATDPAALAARFRRAALLNAAAAPFALLFLLTFGFMRHAERFYHHPSSAAARRWSPLASWALREFNELPHYADHRLAGAADAAAWYVAQFPAHGAAHVARFVAFVAGSLAALLLLAAALDDRLLERPLYGRHVVWWVAGLGLVLAAARGVAGDGEAEAGACRAPEPERALAAVCAATHARPRHWRGRAHAREVRGEVGRLFRYRAALFMEEVTAVLYTPALLWWALPACAPALCAFVREHTACAAGVGDVVSLAAWGGGGGGGGDDAARSAKVDASVVSFAAAYPTWTPRPGSRAAALLAAVASRVGGGGGGGGGGAGEGAAAAGAGAASGLNLVAAAASAWPAWGWAGAGGLPPPGLGGAKAGGGAAGPAARPGDGHGHHHPPPGGAFGAFASAAPSAADDHGRIALAHLALQALVDERDAAAAARGGEEVAWPAEAAPVPPAPAAPPPPHPPASAPRPTPGPGGGGGGAWHGTLTHELATVASWSGGGGGVGGGGGGRGSSAGGAPATPSPPDAGAALAPAPSADGGISGDPGLLMPPPPPPHDGDGRSSGSGGGGLFGPPSGASSGSAAGEPAHAAAGAASAAWGSSPPGDLGLEAEGQRWGGGSGGGPPDLI